MHSSQWIILPTQSCLFLYSFCANLLHLLIICLIVSSLSPHNLYLFFCCVWSIFVWIWFMLMSLFCAAIRRDLVSPSYGFHYYRLSFLAVLSNAVVWIVSIRPPTSKSSRPFNNPLVTVPNAPITIGTIVKFMFHSFFKFSNKVEVLILLFTFLQIYSVVRRDSKVDNFTDSLFFLLIIMRSGFLVGIWWSVCMLKSHRSLCESFSRMGDVLCIYHLLVWSNWNFLHISQWITLPTQSCLALYSFYANLLHSLIMWLIVSSLSPHSLQLQFCWVLFILALI